MDSVCSRCLGHLTLHEDAVLSIQEPGDTATTFVVGDYELVRLADAIRTAHECGWGVKIGTVLVTPAITTWRGDPVCELHLFEQMDEERRNQAMFLPSQSVTAGMPFLIHHQVR